MSEYAAMERDVYPGADILDTQAVAGYQFKTDASRLPTSRQRWRIRGGFYNSFVSGAMAKHSDGLAPGRATFEVVVQLAGQTGPSLNWTGN